MIAPGWLPPLARPRARRRLAWRRKQRSVHRGAARPPTAPAPAEPAAELPWMARAALPVATLVPRGDDRGAGRWLASLGRWGVERWSWVRPRIVPLVAAVLGLVGVVGARRHLLTLARGEPPAVLETARAEPEAAHRDHEDR